jgi:hypothetical protein
MQKPTPGAHAKEHQTFAPGLAVKIQTEDIAVDVRAQKLELSARV